MFGKEYTTREIKSSQSVISLTQNTILTILTHNALPLTKSYDKDEQGNVTKTPYPRAKTFTASALDAPNIHALASALTTLANRPQSAVVRASLRDGSRSAPCPTSATWSGRDVSARRSGVGVRR